MKKSRIDNVLITLSKKERDALKESVDVIWLNDGSDYLNGLWGVIRAILGDDFYYNHFDETKENSFDELYQLLREDAPVETTDCPRCQSDDTYMMNDFLQKASELRKCENCGCEYEVIYDMQIKEIKINK